MNFNLLTASDKDKTAIENLMQFYIYDFSEFIKYDVEETGQFAPYPHLEDYWSDPDKFPYIIKNDGFLAGFVLVKFVRSEVQHYFSIAEFFIMKKYRHTGAGKAMAKQVFDLHKGHWEVHQRESNKPAQLFWNKVITEYTKGQFTEHVENGKRIQNFESSE